MTGWVTEGGSSGAATLPAWPLQAQPAPLWQTLSRAMQLSPQAFPFVHTLQHFCAVVPVPTSTVLQN